MTVSAVGVGLVFVSGVVLGGMAMLAAVWAAITFLKRNDG